MSTVIGSSCVIWFQAPVSAYFYLVLAAIFILFIVTLYCIEYGSRKLFSMYKDKQTMEEKSASILKLFPESLAIVNLSKREFLYYNEPFSHFFENSLLEKTQILSDLSRDYLTLKDSISIKITYTLNNKRRS